MRFVALIFFIVVLSIVFFLPGLPGDFVFDDGPNIVSNDRVAMKELTLGNVIEVISTPQGSGATRSLPALSFALDYWRGGGQADSAVFKTTNILLHGLTAWAVFALFSRILSLAGVGIARVRWLAAALALAWALHPLMVSSVLYVVQRLQTMGTLFLVLALIAYLAGRQAQMAGQSGRRSLLAAFLLWMLALSCKEDSVLLPAYTLALEVCLLRFAAADAVVARRWHWLYGTGVVLGVLVFVFWVVPTHWHAEAYPGRDFSTPERLLTQGRVLVMYLGQIVWPLPSSMPFYYDWLEVSRGWLQPWTTLPSWLLVIGLLALAVWQRESRPLFALGVLLYFSAHVIASNVIGLEMAFEHRNHFALIGAVLAIGSVIAEVASRFRLPVAVQVGGACALLAMLAVGTSVRSLEWQGARSQAEASARYAPASARAWSQLCTDYFRGGGGAVASNSLLPQAVAACEKGAKNAAYSINNAALLVVLKTLQGADTDADWVRVQQRMRDVVMTWDNQRAPLILTYHLKQGVELERDEVLQVLETLARRTELSAFQSANFGYLILNDLQQPEAALSFFKNALDQASSSDPFFRQLADEYRQLGRSDLAFVVEGWQREKAFQEVDG